MINNHGASKTKITLDEYDNSYFNRGAPRWKEALWLCVQALFISSWIPGSYHRRFVLTLFGADIGKNVELKPYLKVKFPWKLSIGDYTWIGESCWIDNLEKVTIGKHCCLSQGSYLCSGNHDWSSSKFDLVVKPIQIKDYAWIAAFAKVAPGVEIGKGAMLGLGSVAAGNLQPWKIYSGVPASYIKDRVITDC